MGPTRTSKTPREGGASSHKAGPSKPKFKKKEPERESTRLPGVQKLKAALRQTKRLLAKVCESQAA